MAQLEDLASWVESEWARSFFTHNQEQQRAATEGLATITRSIADGVLVFDRQGKVVHVNRLAEHYLGVTNPLQAGDNVLEIVPAGPARNHLQWLLDHGPPQAPMRSDVLLRTAHGNQVPVEVTMTSTEDKAWFVAIGHDVSERVRHEKALAALGQRFESILDAAADAIVRVNRKGLIEYANSSMARLLGVPQASLIGADLHRSHHHQLDGTHYGWAECPTHRAIRSGVALQELEEVYWRADGTPVTVSCSVTPVSNPSDGTITGAVMVMRDVESRRRLDRLKKAAFIANVSHELRTPLTAIKGALALLLGDAVGPVPPDQQQLLEIAHTSTDRLVRLVNDLLDLGRLDAARLILQKRRISLGALIHNAIDGVAVHATTALISVQTKVSTEASPYLEVDPDRVVQILTNLLANAIRFSTPNGKVQVSAQQQRREVRISVRDWGSGIAPEARDTIFDRFVQADASDRRALGGTGLGLAIARELARAHGGRLALGAARNGTVFHLWLPLPAAWPEA